MERFRFISASKCAIKRKFCDFSLRRSSYQAEEVVLCTYTLSAQNCDLIHRLIVSLLPAISVTETARDLVLI